MLRKDVLSHRREAIRLWFEYLKLAHLSSSPIIQEALKKSKKFYEPWEIEEYSRFDQWWATHRHLFEERFVIRRLKPSESPSDPSALILEIPLRRSPTELLKTIKEMINDALDEVDKKPQKSKKRPSSSFSLSVGSEPKLRAVRDMLSVYKQVHLKNPKLRGEKLLRQIQSYYRGRRKNNNPRLPIHFEYRDGDPIDLERALKNVRRYIQRADKIILNVAKGEFPGRYT